MSELIDYFVRHYTLVLDNDQVTYDMVTETARDVVVEEEPSMEEYRTMSAAERVDNYADAIGEKILELIDEWLDEVVIGHSATPGGLLIREIMLTNGSDLERKLGEHYMPEDSDMEGLLDEED